MNNWKKAQEHEREYCFLGKNKQWKTPHSLEYWKKFLHLKTLDGVGIEIGCGPNGLYNFTERVVGIDPINYKKKNFVVGVAESLPFRKFDYAICCNGIDHFQDINISLDEILSLTNKLVIWLNMFPLIVSKIMSIFDKTHPYHLTKNEIMEFVSNHKLFISYFQVKNIYSIHGKNASKFAKIKLFFASCLGIKGICLHLEVKND